MFLFDKIVGFVFIQIFVTFAAFKAVPMISMLMEYLFIEGV